MNAVPSGQWDACAVLGYPFAATMRRIILPQTIQNVFPAIVGELEQLLKSTSLLAAIGVTELTRTGMNVISRELNPIQIYVTIAGIYLCLTALLQLLTMFCPGRSRYDSY
jgi:ABC-type amino acid transport system permease subunit